MDAPPDPAELFHRVLELLDQMEKAQAAKVIASSPIERGLVFINLHLHDLFDQQLLSPVAPLSAPPPRASFRGPCMSPGHRP